MRKKWKCLTAIQARGERISAFYESTALCMDSYVGIPSGWFKKESCVFLGKKEEAEKSGMSAQKRGSESNDMQVFL